MRSLAYTPADYARPAATALRKAGYHVKTFTRVGNPLDWDSGVRPDRTAGKCEMLARIDCGRKSAWVWVECDEAQILDVQKVADEFGLHFSSVGYPR